MILSFCSKFCGHCQNTPVAGRIFIGGEYNLQLPQPFLCSLGIQAPVNAPFRWDSSRAAVSLYETTVFAGCNSSSKTQRKTQNLEQLWPQYMFIEWKSQCTTVIHTVCYTPATFPLGYFQDSRNFRLTYSHRTTPKRNSWRKCLQKNESVKETIATLQTRFSPTAF